MLEKELHERICALDKLGERTETITLGNRIIVPRDKFIKWIDNETEKQ